MKKLLLKMLNALLSQQCSELTERIRKEYPMPYWANHPDLYVTMYMKHDFFSMDVAEFLIKYIGEMEDPGTSPKRRLAIEGVVHRMYMKVTERNYGVNYWAAYGIESAT